MPWNVHRVGAMAALLISVVARSAYADGALPSEADIDAFLFKVLIVLVIVIGMPIVVIAVWWRAGKAASRRPPDRRAGRAIPMARTIKDKDLDRPA